MDKPTVERPHATVETAAEDRRPVPGRSGWSPRRYTLLAMGAAVLTMGLKFVAFLITDSVGLFSDAAESGINLAPAIVAFAASRSPLVPPTRSTPMATPRPSTSPADSRGL